MRRISLLHSVRFALFSPVIALTLNYVVNLATASNAGDNLATVYFALYGIYCLQNFIRCREYHCMITGPGFLLASLLMIFRDTMIFDHGFGLPYVVFTVVALIGHTLEWRYVQRSGSHFLR
jgi:hypothetical protein